MNTLKPTMKYNPKKHHRRSIRKKGYDYSSAGNYFITICCKNMAHLYGEIKDEKMILNDAGIMIDKWYWKLEEKYDDIRCREMIIMPNHFHCILENTGAPITKATSATTTVPADPRVCPPPEKGDPPPETGETSNINDPTSDGSLNDNLLDELDSLDELDPLDELCILGEHVGAPLPRVLQWFKTMTTNEYIRGVKTLGWRRFDGKMWQRNYWEHIIRDEQSYNRIAKYIIDNPKKWKGDKFR